MTTATHTIDSIKFGVEIETTGRNRQQVANAIAPVLGGVARRVGGYYDKFAVADAQGRDWICMTDASINGIGTEIVTPPLKGAEDMATLQAVVRAAKRAGASVDSSCGIHVHVDGAGFVSNPKALSNLVKLWGRFESLVMGTMLEGNREGSRWCRPVSLRLAEAARKGFSSLQDAGLAFYGYRPTPGGEDHYNNARYRALNLHNLWYRTGGARTVEFRAFAGTMHAGKIRAYVTLCLAMAAKALNARSVPNNKRDFDPAWTGYAMNALFRTLGINTGERFKNVRTHLMRFSKGHAGHASPAKMVTWAVKHGRNLDTVRAHCPPGFDFDGAVSEARAAAAAA